MKRNRLGTDGPEVPVVCVGTSPLGGLPTIYGYDVEAGQAVATIRRVLESPIDFIDTSNEYANGESERRIGEALRSAAGGPGNVVLATKADPALWATEFPGSRVRESFRESTERLGVDRFEVFYLHDPERFDFGYMTAPGGAVEAMVQLRTDGLATAIGVAGGDISEMRRYVDLGVFDVILNHNRYTLLDRSADALIDHAVNAGLSFINAAPYASGMLAKRASARPRYQYRAPSPEIVRTTAWLHQECARFQVPLAALALQFSTRDPRISSTVVGVSAPERVDELVENEQREIPSELWDSVRERLALPLTVT